MRRAFMSIQKGTATYPEGMTLGRRTLNLGILAHVDAGKTTLTERLLHAAGVIDEVGSVDDGSTQTDSLALERQRGITIKSAVVSFVVDDVTVNLIDTPGHPDFIAEVERVLSVLDGAVLVVSAVEGVQAQTRILMRALQRLRIPTLLFVNKIDRAGAGYEPCCGRSPTTDAGDRRDGSRATVGTRAARFTPWADDDAALATRLTELLAEHDDSILAAYVEDAPSRTDGCAHELAAQTAQALVHPVYFGSAITGAGVESLTAGIAELLPGDRGDADGPCPAPSSRSSAARPARRSPTSACSPARSERATGCDPAGDDGKVTAISVFDRGSAVRRTSVVRRGDRKALGLGDIRIGDAIGELADGRRRITSPRRRSKPSSFRDPADKGALHAALTQLAEQDPLIDLRQDDVRQNSPSRCTARCRRRSSRRRWRTTSASTSRSARRRTICVERPAGTGAAVEILRAEPNPFLATVGLRIDRRHRFGRRVPARGRRSHGPALRRHKTVAGLHAAHRISTCAETLQRGALRLASHRLRGGDDRLHVQRSRLLSIAATGPTQHGRRLPKSSRRSSSGARSKHAGTVVCESIFRVSLEIPHGHGRLGHAPNWGGSVLRSSMFRHVAGGRSPRSRRSCPAARVQELQRQLPALTGGAGRARRSRSLRRLPAG